MTRKYYLSLLLLLAIIKQTTSRWLACTDYIQKNGDYWNPVKCRGFPRDAKTYANKYRFGLDRGYDYRPRENDRACKTKLKRSSYSQAYPRAIYFPGQQVVLAHPMKGHGAATCNNMWIPDHGSKILRGRKSRDSNRLYKFYIKQLVTKLGASPYGKANKHPDKYPKLGYQNAPKFCQNKDKALATYSFNVPQELDEGSYTFVWSWAFNRPEEVYTTCFEVTITTNKTMRDELLKKRNKSINLSVPCGGILSDGKEGSSQGCSKSPSSEPIESTTLTSTVPISTTLTTTTLESPTVRSTPSITTTTTTTAKAYNTLLSTTRTPTTLKSITSNSTTSTFTAPTSSTLLTTTPSSITQTLTTLTLTTLIPTTPVPILSKSTKLKLTIPISSTPKSTTTILTTPKLRTLIRKTTPKLTTTKPTVPTSITPKSITTTIPTTLRPAKQESTTTKSTIRKLTTVVSNSQETTEKITFETTTTLQLKRYDFVNRKLPIYGYQLSGVFQIGVPPPSITNRILKVDFQCNIDQAIFYNADVIERVDNGKYTILQKNKADVQSGKIEFFIAFSSCKVTKKPKVYLVHED